MRKKAKQNKKKLKMRDNEIGTKIDKKQIWVNVRKKPIELKREWIICQQDVNNNGSTHRTT